MPLIVLLFAFVFSQAQFSGQKLPGSNYVKKFYKVENGSDTLWKAYQKLHTVYEANDTVLYIEVYKSKRYWKRYRFLIKNEKRIVDGDQFEFDQIGRVSTILHCQKGEKECPYWTSFTWWNNDAINKQGDFINGSPDGVHRTWYNNGQLRSLVIYEDGKLKDIDALFDIEGNELKRGTLSDGNGTVLIYSMNGKAIEERNYINGKAQGKKKALDK